MTYSIVTLSDVRKAKRFDAEYFKPEYLEIERKLQEVGSENISKLSNNINYGLNIEPVYTKEGVNFIRAQNLKLHGIDGKILKLPLNFETLKENETLKEGNLIIVRSGANVGDIGIITKDFENSTFGSYIIKFDVKNKINPFFAYIFLKSYYGKNQTTRLRSGAAQPNISIPNLNEVLIPHLKSEFQKEIENTFFQAHHAQSQSKQLYKDAETLLLQELGLLGYEPQHRRSFTTTKREVDQAQRCDAEYFQPKYAEINKRIFKNGYILLQDICSAINYGTVPTSPYTNDNSGIPYIKGLNLKNTEIDKTKLDKIKNTEDLPRKFYTKKGDIIISQMGTVGDIGVVTESEEGWLFASFTIRARLKNIIEFNPLYVGLYIQNIAKKYYLLRNIAQASVRQNTDLPTIKNMPIPLIDASIQADIAEKVRESHRLRKHSKDLLHTATQAVELAIEQNEAAAFAFLA